jgi:hypothetical protein
MPQLLSEHACKPLLDRIQITDQTTLAPSAPTVSDPTIVIRWPGLIFALPRCARALCDLDRSGHGAFAELSQLVPKHPVNLFCKPPVNLFHGRRRLIIHACSDADKSFAKELISRVPQDMLKPLFFFDHKLLITLFQQEMLDEARTLLQLGSEEERVALCNKAYLYCHSTVVLPLLTRFDLAAPLLRQCVDFMPPGRIRDKRLEEMAECYKLSGDYEAMDEMLFQVEEFAPPPLPHPELCFQRMSRPHEPCSDSTPHTPLTPESSSDLDE